MGGLGGQKTDLLCFENFSQKNVSTSLVRDDSSSLRGVIPEFQKFCGPGPEVESLILRPVKVFSCLVPDEGESGWFWTNSVFLLLHKCDDRPGLNVSVSPLTFGFLERRFSCNICGLADDLRPRVQDREFVVDITDSDSMAIVQILKW